jgi:Ni,Fe-hydrogenase III large subunit
MSVAGQDRARAGELQADTLPSAAAWTARTADALADGWRFAGLDARPHRDGGVRARLVLARAERLLLLDCRQPDRALPSLLPHIPAAQWDEREAHDRHGIAFVGHAPLRPLLRHPEQLAEWTTPVRGRDVHQVAVGPIHAGIIESGHFRFHVVGERILQLDPQLFYKHRGIEQAAEGEPADVALAQLARACGACTVANAVAFAQAWELAVGLMPDDALRRTRTLLLELERLYSHLGDVAAVCAGVGLGAGAMAFAALKERAHRLNEQLTGHRFLFDAVAVARSELNVDHVAAREAAGVVAELRDDVRRAWRQLQFSHSAQERLVGCGVVTRADALMLGATGPAARACGIAEDVRCHSPRLRYDGFAPALPEAPTGDCAARLELRGAELDVTLGLLAELLGQPLRPGATRAVGCRPLLGASRVESPRGATLCLLELDPPGERLAAVRLRTGSYANWPVLAHAVTGELLPDFPLINKSFELCYACVDR